MSAREDLLAHLAGGCTTVCRTWAVTRKDGVVLGFTDHDVDLNFEGILFRAGTGLSARALQQTTGLSVDNSEAMGALSSAAVTEEDILSGRYDGAELRAWLVNWASVGQRILQFRGSLGDIVRSGGFFKAEMRGLTEALNQMQGRAYQRDCTAILGDRHCRFDVNAPGYFWEAAVAAVADRRLFRIDGTGGFVERFFERGRIIVQSGAAKGLIGIVKFDRIDAVGRVVELWEQFGPEVETGDILRLEAGCNRSAETCRTKFANFVNFRGFPDIPGEDWLISYPVGAGRNDGGSLSS